MFPKQYFHKICALSLCLGLTNFLTAYGETYSHGENPYGRTNPGTGIVNWGELEYQHTGERITSDRIRAVQLANEVLAGELPGGIQPLVDRYVSYISGIQRAIDRCDRGYFDMYMSLLQRTIETLRTEYQAEVQRLVAINHEFYEMEKEFIDAQGGNSVRNALLTRGGGALGTAARHAVVSDAASLCHPITAVAMTVASLITLAKETWNYAQMRQHYPRLLARLELKLYYERGVLPAYRGNLEIMQTYYDQMEERFDENACWEGDCVEEGEGAGENSNPSSE